MRTTTGTLGTHLTGRATTLATCWRIVRADAEVYTFTDHDADLEVGGETYVARTGYRRTAVQSAGNAEVDNLDVEGVVDDDSITEADIRRGLWDYAEVRIFVVNWQSPDAGLMKLRRGWLGEVQTSDAGSFTAELRGLAQVLVQKVGDVFTPECRAQLGDARCGVTLATFTETGSIDGAPIDTTRFTAAGIAEADGYYEGGVLEFTTGDNAGVRREVLDWTSGVITLFVPPPYTMAAADEFTVTAGCDHSIATCRDRFDNAVNYRGFPTVPGSDTLLFAGVPTGDAGGGKK